MKKLRLLASAIALVLAATLLPILHANAEVSFVAATQAGNVKATSLSIPHPSAAQVGDVLIASVNSRGVPVFSRPAGWSLVVQNTISATSVYRAYVHVVDSSEPASWTWNLSSSEAAVGAIVAYRGVDNTSPVDVSAGQSNSTGSKKVTAPSLTTSGASRLLFIGGQQGVGSFSPPSGMTERVDAFNDSKHYDIKMEIADESRPQAGPTGSRIATSTTTKSSVGLAIALRVASSEPTPDPTPEPTPEPTPTCEGLRVTGDLRTAMNAAPAGTNFCLSGTYAVTQTIAPQTGDKLVGPATIVGEGVPLIFDGGSDVVFDTLDVSGAKGDETCMPRCGRAFKLGSRAVVRDSYVHHNDVSGIGGSNGDVLIVGSEFAFNGQRWNLGCCGGGAKFVNSATILDSTAHDNLGNGFWCDVDCGRWDVADVDVYRNTRKGIAVEISNGPVTMNRIRAWENNVGEGSNEYSGGINFTASANITANDLWARNNGYAGLHIKESGTRGFTIQNVLVDGYDVTDIVIGCNHSGVTCRL
jgi:hypothetical protein